MNKAVALAAALIFIFGTPAISHAGEKSSEVTKTTWQDLFSDIIGHYPIKSVPVDDDNAGQKSKLNLPKNWLFDVNMQRYIVSYTSYEFGNPGASFQNPISRLEFPLNTWWMNIVLRRTCPRWSVGGRAGMSVARNIVGKMMDSDWQDEASPDMVTSYSEGYSRALQNYLFRGDIDVNISDWLRLPPGLEIRPLFAFQFQRHEQITYDGMQWNIGQYALDEEASGPLDKATSSSQLSGDSIRFQQDYYLYLIGLRGSYELFKPTRDITIKPHVEADWGPAIGYNIDHHLQRPGNRITIEKTSGNALYFAAGLDMVFYKTVTAGFTVDYLMVRTSGSHQNLNVPQGTDEVWSDHVNVWSDQMSLIAHASYAF